MQQKKLAEKAAVQESAVVSNHELLAVVSGFPK